MKEGKEGWIGGAERKKNNSYNLQREEMILEQSGRREQNEPQLFFLFNY